jgi:hypothetical protein
VRYKNWKMYYTMSQPGPAGWIMPLIPFHFTLVQNIKRDPFEQAVGIDQKTALVAPLGGVGNIFATAAVGNDAQRKKGQDRSDVHAPFLADLWRPRASTEPLR